MPVLLKKAKEFFLVDIDKMNVSAGTSTWSNTGDITIEASKKQVRVQALRMLNGKQSISAKGAIGQLEKMSMKISVDHTNISGLRALAGLDIPLEGELSAELGLEGDYMAPHIYGSVNILGADIGGLSFDTIPATLNYTEKNLRFEAHVEKDGKTLLAAEAVSRRSLFWAYKRPHPA